MLCSQQARLRLARIMHLLGRIILLPSGVVVLPTVAAARGMPQLDFTTPLTISQVVWGAIIFVVLYIVLSRTGLPRVASVLEERAARISKDLDDARTTKARADAGVLEAGQATDKARAESQAAINAALEEAKAVDARNSEALNARLQTQLEASEAQIAQARALAMSSLHQVALETAATIVTRLTGAHPETGQLESAIQTALASRGSS